MSKQVSYLLFNVQLPNCVTDRVFSRPLSIGEIIKRLLPIKKKSNPTRGGLSRESVSPVRSSERRHSLFVTGWSQSVPEYPYFSCRTKTFITYLSRSVEIPWHKLNEPEDIEENFRKIPPNWTMVIKTSLHLRYRVSFDSLTPVVRLRGGEGRPETVFECEFLLVHP